MKQLKVKQVDVFTTTPLCGNPVAVVLDAQGLNSEAMQAIAREMNLSETTFVLPSTTPKSDYLLRIFTPRSELPFAGHPTIGTAHAIIEEGRLFKDHLPSLLRQECGIGIVPIGVERKDNGLFFQVTQSEPQWTDTDLTCWDAAEMLGCDQNDFVAGLPLQIVSTGVPWLIILLRTLTAVKALKASMSLVEEACVAIKAVGLTVFSLEAERQDHAVHVRSFAPGLGVSEDPVCGTGNGSVAAYIARHSLMPGERFDYLAEQGSEILRPGTVAVSAELGKRKNGLFRLAGKPLQFSREKSYCKV